MDTNIPSPAMPVHNDADIAAHHYSETADFQRMRASLAEAITQGVSKVLVIYTGGTIGMKQDKVNGYSPAKGYLLEKLKSIGRFHDPEGFNDFDIEFHRSSSTLGVNKSTDGVGAPKERMQHPPSTNALIEAAKRRLVDMSRGYSHTPRVSDDADSEASSKSAASKKPNVETNAADSKLQPQDA
ncbi:hypothetical protein LPJ77_007142, partial [Coemansia sp. RSA 2523]